MNATELTLWLIENKNRAMLYITSSTQSAEHMAFEIGRRLEHLGKKYSYNFNSLTIVVEGRSTIFLRPPRIHYAEFYDKVDFWQMDSVSKISADSLLKLHARVPKYISKEERNNDND